MDDSKTPELTVDCEFRDLIRPLLKDEYRHLEAALLADGCREPITVIALSMAVATGAGVLISSHLGQGEKEKARHIFSLAALCTAVMGLLISVLGNIFIHPLAELLGSTPVIHDEAISYMWYIITFSPFLLFSFLLSGLVRNDNRPKLAMFALMFGSVSNIDITFTAVIFLDMFQFQNFIHIGRPPSSFLIA